MSHSHPSPGDGVLETERLLLRRWRVSDATVHRELWTERDSRVPPHRRIDADGHPTIEDLEEHIRQGGTDPAVGLLVAERRGSGDAIGYCGLIPNVHGQDDEPELAYEFLREVWHQGYATEAARAVLDWARESGFRHLWATIREWNAPSRRVADRLGFVQTDRVEADAAYGDSLFYRKDL